MSQVFSGALLLPGETGEGLEATFEMDTAFVRLVTGDDELGTWDLESCEVSPAGKGAFSMELDGEPLTFSPSSPSAFAEAMTVPLTPDPSSDEAQEGSKYDYDAAIDEVIANVKPLRDPSDDDEILSKPMLVGIVGLSTAVMVGLVAATMVI